MEASADVDHYLQAARQTSMRPWVDHLNADASAGDIERAFRNAWGQRIDAASPWPGESWTPAVLWLRWLPWLPAMGYLASGGPVLEWMGDDPVPGAGRPVDGAGYESARAGNPLQRLLAAEQTQNAWIDRWKALLPESGPWVDALLDSVLAHSEQMRSARAEGNVLRQQLNRSDDTTVSPVRRRPRCVFCLAGHRGTGRRAPAFRHPVPVPRSA